MKNGPYAKEAKKRWGKTSAYKQSRERFGALPKDGQKAVLEKHGAVYREIADCMKNGFAPDSDKTQSAVKKHYENLRDFYDPSPELYAGLAEMYVSDERFRAFYEKLAPGLAEYMRKAMVWFAGKKPSDVGGK